MADLYSSTERDQKCFQEHVRKICSEVQREMRKRKHSLLEAILATERDQLALLHSSPYSYAQQTPSTNGAGHSISSNRKRFHVTQTFEGIKAASSVESVRLPRTDIMPPYTIYTQIKNNYRVSDRDRPTFVPYLGEDKHEKVEGLLSDRDRSYRDQLCEKGPQYLEKDANDVIDETLKQCSQLTYGHEKSTVWEHPYARSAILEIISDAMNQTHGRVSERLEKLLETSKREETGAQLAASPLQTSLKSGYKSQEDRKYLEHLDSYREFFCRRCLIFNCNIHGLVYKPSLNFQTERALEKKWHGTWCTLKNEPFESRGDRFSELKELSEFHKVVCKRMFILYEGDVDGMSIAMRAPKGLISAYIVSQGYKLPQVEVGEPRTSARKKTFYSVKNYQQKWYSAIEKAEIHPMFVPCVHEEKCSEASCSCVRNSMFCTEACCWGSSSPNFFRGCCCSGQCNQKTCTCFATNRECDPDLCKCGTCCDPPDRPATAQRCRNDNIRMRRRVHLLVAPSTVHGCGWGAFTRYAIKKGSFINEYVGEMISQEEGERRGQIDDVKERSYLFNLCSDYAIDACHRGGKCRFLNHSENPNCETRTLFVNGDQRIAILAKEDIDAQSELFFDYRYNIGMDNDLIAISAMSYPWMKEPDEKKRGTAGQTRPLGLKEPDEKKRGTAGQTRPLGLKEPDEKKRGTAGQTRPLGLKEPDEKKRGTAGQTRPLGLP
jgi:hypothetical protein